MSNRVGRKGRLRLLQRFGLRRRAWQRGLSESTHKPRWYMPPLRSWKLKTLAAVLLVGLLILLFNTLRSSAVTLVLKPDGDTTAAWTTLGTTDNSCAGGTHCDFVDDGTTDNTADAVEVLSTNTTASVTDQYTLTTASNVASATQLVVRIYMEALTASNGGTMDSISLSLIVNGTAQTATTCTPTNGTWTACTATYTGSWVQSDVDSVQVKIVRNILGSGNPSKQTDTVVVSNVYGTLTYSPAVQYTQSAYRWFANQDADSANNTIKGMSSSSKYSAGSGSWPTSIADADLNGDGKPDLAVADSNTGSVSILLGKGDGTFQPKVDYVVSGNPYAVTTADFNGDGKPDLATANNSANTASILLGKGDGTFQPAATFPTGADPYDIVATDFNGDGYQDIATANYMDSTISVLLGQGSGTFQAKIDYVSGPNPQEVNAADLNRDGKVDLISTSEAANTVSVFGGNGDGTFQAKADYATGSNPRGSTVVDMNKDGKLDLVTVNNGANTVSILLGKGDGSFNLKNDYSVGGSPYSVTSKDFNGDGAPDLAVADEGSNDVSILMSMGINTSMAVASPLAAQDTLATASAEGTTLRLRLNLHVGGGQADPGLSSFKLQYTAKGGAVSCGAATGYADVTDASTIRYADNQIALNGSSLIANANDPVHGTDTNNLQTYQEKGTTTFTNSSTIPISQDGMWDFALVANHTLQGDHYCFKIVNGNGGDLNGYNVYPEIIMPSATVGQGSYRFFQNQDGTVGSGGALSFANPVSYTVGAVPWGVATADFNGDGKPDMAVNNDSDGTISVLFNNGNGTFTTNATYISGDKSSYPYPDFMTTGDFNGDGKMDIAATDTGENLLSVFINKGNGTFNAALNTPTSQQPEGIAAADFNGDGKTDLAVANNSPSTVSIFTNNGSASFTLQGNYASTVYPYDLRVGDFNGDGKPDLVNSDNGGTGGAAVLINNGSGAFNTKVALTGYSSSSVAVADFNGDGKKDVISVESNNNTMSVYLGKGDGTFQSRSTFAYGSAPQDVKVADFNGDGKQDLIATNSSGNAVSFILGNGDGTFQTSSATAYTVQQPYYGAVADFNGDGKLDYAVADEYYASTSVYVLMNVSAGSSTIGVGTPLAPQHTVAELTGTAATSPFRVRMLFAVQGAGVTKQSLNMKLQFAVLSGLSCSVVPSASYSDVTTSSTVRFYDNPNATNASPMSTNAGDPTDGSNTIRYQAYYESNSFTNTASDIYAGEDGLWDFALVLAPATSHKSFCLRAVNNSGSALSAYSYYPQVSQAPTMDQLMRQGNWFSRSTGKKQALVL